MLSKTVATSEAVPLIQLWPAFKAKKLPFADPQTIYQYDLNIFRRFAEYLAHDPTTDDLTDENVTGCMAWLVRTRKLAPSSANKLRDNFNAFWGFLARQRIVEKYPEIAEMNEPEKIPVAWSREQLSTLWDALARQPGDWGGLPCNLWWTTLHNVMWDSNGERIGAVRQIRSNQLDLDAGWVTIRPETRKGKKRGAVCKLHPTTIADLRLFMLPDPDREYVWPFPYAHGEYIYELYRAILKSAGLPAGRDRAFHCVRRSVASWYEAIGGDAQKMLGHSSRAITLKYLDPTICEGVSSSSSLFRPSDPKAAQVRLA